MDAASCRQSGLLGMVWVGSLGVQIPCHGKDVMPTSDQIEIACDNYTERYGVRVSEDARRLITLLIRAVEADPYPRWESVLPPSRRRAQFEVEASQITERLPVLLDVANRLAVRSDPELRERRILTTFHLAHHMARSLELAAELGGIRRL